MYLLRIDANDPLSNGGDPQCFVSITNANNLEPKSVIIDDQAGFNIVSTFQATTTGISVMVAYDTSGATGCPNGYSSWKL